MPLIHIKSLPMPEGTDIKETLLELCRELAKDLTVDTKDVLVTWEYFQPHHYATRGTTEKEQPRNEFPILIDILAPDFHGRSRIERMFKVITNILTMHAKIPRDNVFINCRLAHSGMVFDEGSIKDWDEQGGS